MFDVDENGDKYITTTASGVGISVRIDAVGTVYASSETRHHAEIVAYAEWLGQSGTTNIGTPSGFVVDLNNTIRGTMTWNASNTGYTQGFYPSFSGFTGASAGAILSGPYKDCIPMNRPFRFGIFGDKGAGVAGVCIEGVRIGGWTATPSATWATSVNFALPATAGVRWRIYAKSTQPCKSWTGTDHEFSPDYTRYANSEDGLVKCWPHIATDGLHGNLWSYSGTVTLSEFETSGLNPNRKRMVGGSGGVTATSKLDIGAVSFNRKGHAAFVTSLFVPSSGTASIAIRNAANSADVLKLQVASNGQLQNGAGTQLTASDGTAMTIASDRRYFLIVNLSRDGTAAWTLIDASNDPASRIVWSNAISGGWTVADLGKIILTASQNAEWDRVDICRWWTNAITDSLSAAYTATVSPRIATTANNLGYAFPHTDALAIPGVGFHSWMSGWTKDSMLATTGRSGTTRASWATNARAYMTHTKAMRIFALDGACYNDINTGTTATSMLALVVADIAFATLHGHEIILMPAFERPVDPTNAAGMTHARRVQRRAFNALQRSLVVQSASNDLVFYCDHTLAHSEPITSTDYVHPSASVNIAGKAIASSKMSAKRFANLSDSSSGSQGSYLTRTSVVKTTGSGLSN